MSIHWGIMGTGAIAEKFVNDFTLTSGGCIKAIASRTRQRAEEFALNHNVTVAYGSYQELAEDNSIDVIYIATPHSMHYENTMLCLENGRSVLCEKPIAINSAQLEQMQALARQKNVLLMEAMWMYFMPLVSQIKKWIDSGRIGNVKCIKADFGYSAIYKPDSRWFNPTLAGGALLDLGIYPVTFANYILESYPTQIQAIAQKAPSGVDGFTGITFQYKNGCIVQMSCSLICELIPGAYIFGSRGYINIPYFWKARKATLVTDDGTEEALDERLSIGYNYEIEEVHKLLNAGAKESSLATFERSMRNMLILDKIRDLIDLKYPVWGEK
jgi:predicted dehydrogenase